MPSTRGSFDFFAGPAGVVRGGKGCEIAGCGSAADVPIGPKPPDGSVPEVWAISDEGNGAEVCEGGGGCGSGIDAIVGNEAEVGKGADVIVSSPLRGADV